MRDDSLVIRCCGRWKTKSQRKWEKQIAVCSVLVPLNTDFVMSLGVTLLSTANAGSEMLFPVKGSLTFHLHRLVHQRAVPGRCLDAGTASGRNRRGRPAIAFGTGAGKAR